MGYSILRNSEKNSQRSRKTSKSIRKGSQRLGTVCPKKTQAKSKLIKERIGSSVCKNPYNFSVFAVDPGNDAGWAWFTPSGLYRYGEIRLDEDAPQVEVLLRQFLKSSEARKTYPVLVIENVSWGRQNTAGPTGIWRYMARSLGLKKVQLHAMHTGTWRKLLYGKGNLDTSSAKQRALEVAEEIYGVTNITHNTAEAILIGHVAHRWSDLHDKLPKKKISNENSST